MVTILKAGYWRKVAASSRARKSILDGPKLSPKDERDVTMAHSKLVDEITSVRPANQKNATKTMSEGSQKREPTRL
jgi:hypothetical protein